MAITDLTGTIWVFDELPQSDLFSFDVFNIDFDVAWTDYDKTHFNKIGFRNTTVGEQPYFDLFFYTADNYSYTVCYVYYNERSAHWASDKTIRITGGADAKNSDLIAILYDMATPTLDTLAGTSWLINSSIPTTSVDFNSLNFTADYGTQSYTRFRIYNSQLRYYYSSTSYDTAYRYSAWTQQGYRTINIAGGTGATSQTAIDWFLANAVQIIPTHTITYSTPRGTAPSQKTEEEGYRLIASDLPTLTYTGWVHLGWFYESTFTTEARVGDELNSNITLYAKWVQSVTYTLTYHSEHGITPSQRSVIENYQLVSGDLPVLTDDEFIFMNWYYDSSFTSLAQVGDTITENKNLYAKWQSQTKPIFIDNSAIRDIYIGADKIGSIFIGNERIY